MAGNGSYIVRRCGLDLHGPTLSMSNELTFSGRIFNMICHAKVTLPRDIWKRYGFISSFSVSLATCIVYSCKIRNLWSFFFFK